jgi:hypothetical protein
MNPTTTPILFLIFNRPSHTKKVFDAIKIQKPKTLFIAADGPRKDRPGEFEKCELVKKNVLDAIDWDCDVKLLFRTENLGCGKAVYGAINWFFENVEEGIILEDDCVPGNSFFYFCEELLNRYRDTEQIMHINGTRFQHTSNFGNKSYYFSNYIHPYGWATWRRAWQKYQFDIPVETSEEFKIILKQKFPDVLERHLWETSFLGMAQNKIDTWDTQWNYSIYKSSGFAITPVLNLVSNIGFDDEATHTNEYTVGIADLSINTIDAIVHPQKIAVSKPADRHTYKKHYELKITLFNKLKFKIGKVLPFVKTAYLRLFLKKDF